MQTLTPPDSTHLLAAQGWLELGNHLEAKEELERISAPLRTHPDVLEVRWHIYAKENKWEACYEIALELVEQVPTRSDSWVHRSFALHCLKRTQDAFDNLVTAANFFPHVWVIPYNLACYCAQLNRLDEAASWFKKAMAIDEKTVQNEAVEDEDLKLLWDSMGGMSWRLE